MNIIKTLKTILTIFLAQLVVTALFLWLSSLICAGVCILDVIAVPLGIIIGTVIGFNFCHTKFAKRFFNDFF